LFPLSRFNLRDPPPYAAYFVVRHSGFPKGFAVQGAPARVLPESLGGSLYRHGQFFLQKPQFFHCTREEGFDHLLYVVLQSSNY
jgi:hypothetical protein